MIDVVNSFIRKNKVRNRDALNYDTGKNGTSVYCKFIRSMAMNGQKVL